MAPNLTPDLRNFRGFLQFKEAFAIAGGVLDCRPEVSAVAGRTLATAAVVRAAAPKSVIARFAV